MVEHVFALLLTLTRRLDSYRQRVNGGDWCDSREFCLFDETIAELSGHTFGIIGYGVLGRAVAKVARAFSMKVLVAESLTGAARTGRVPLHTLLENADIVSLHCPLSEATRHLIDAPALARMKPDAILINTARGGIVDEQALVDALRQNRLQAAAIDVLAEEPPRTRNPLLAFDSPRLIITPHVAWASQPARQRLVRELSENIAAFLCGTPRNTVN